MTVGQLKRNADSMELTLWGAYLAADAAEQEFRREQASKEAELTRYVNGG
jgi:hypothetical protein